MITWFEVENFKSIKKLRLDFKPFMVLVGPNGAGKTNIVQALDFFLDILIEESINHIDYLKYDQLIRRRKRPARYMRFALELPVPVGGLDDSPLVRARQRSKGHLPMEIDLTIRSDANQSVYVENQTIRMRDDDGSFIRIVWNAKGKKIEKIECDPNTRIGRWFEERYKDINNMFLHRDLGGGHEVGVEEPENVPWEFYWAMIRFVLIPSLKTFRMTCLRLDSSALRQDVASNDKRYGNQLGPSGEGLPLAIENLRQDPRSFQKVLRGLNSVYPRIEDISAKRIMPGRTALAIKERSIEGDLGEANISDGVLYALALLVALETTQSRVLAIEEPENALHPWALREIMERAQADASRKEPLLMTTHSPVVVDAVRDPASLFIVENSEKQGTTVTPALTKETALRAILSESGMKLGEVWLGGMLGGVPGADK